MRRVRRAFLAGARDVAAVARLLGGEPGVVKGVEEGDVWHAERLRDRHALRIDRRGDPPDRCA